MDVLDGPGWYEIIFNFKESEPYNAKFDEFGMGDMNFFNNSGSMLIIVVFMILNAIFWHLVIKFSKKFYQNRWARRIGMYADGGAELKYPMLLMIVEGYTDLILGGLIGSYKIFFSKGWSERFLSNFSNFSNFFLTISTISITFGIVMLPFYVRLQITKKFAQLDNNNVIEEIGVFYEEYATKYKS
jgi:hypothetical protein